MTLARPGSRFLSFVSPYYQEEGKEEEEEALIRDREREITLALRWAHRFPFSQHLLMEGPMASFRCSDQRQPKCKRIRAVSPFT